MKKTLFLLTVLFIPFVSAVAQEDKDIVIEMRGKNVATPQVASMLWNYNARQLTQKWRGKTREQLLYKVPVVSDRDGIVRGEETEYTLVEYFNEGQFRKFLFNAEAPQTFVAAAATPADVLAINKKYKINIGLNLADFETAYGKRAHLASNENLPENTVLYRLAYSDVNTPKPQQNWFLFENKKLVKTFYTPSETEDYLKTLLPTTKSQTQSSDTTKKPFQKKPVAPRKALVWGGTTYDQAYMPKIVNPDPKLVFSDTKAK